MNETILDLEEFMERVQDDKELLLELLDIFTEDFPTKRSTLGEAVQQKDFEKLRSVAHSLKGALGNISAKTLRDTCLKFEDMGKNSDLSGAEELLVKIDEQYGALKNRIESLKDELK